MKKSGILQDRSGRAWLAFSGAEIHYGDVVAQFALMEMPEEALRLFQRFEQIVSKQEFSFLPDIEKEIEAFGLCILWEGDKQLVPIDNVQIAGGKVSFRTNAAVP